MVLEMESGACGDGMESDSDFRRADTRMCDAVMTSGSLSPHRMSAKGCKLLATSTMLIRQNVFGDQRFLE